MADNKLSVIVELKKEDKPWYVPDNPTWGDCFVAISLLIAVLTWLYNSKKNREQRKAQLDQEKEDLNWRRTEFLFAQGRYFDTDPDISEAIKIITGDNADIQISDLFDYETGEWSPESGNARHQLDKLLNLMERLSYSYDKKILTLEELRNFDWYFSKVKNDKHINKYCLKYYPEVLNVANSLEKGC